MEGAEVIVVGAGQAWTSPWSTAWESPREIRRATGRCAPAVEHGDQFDVTPDHQPIVGPVGDKEGLWMAAGYSGHGFMLAPAISRRLAEAMLEGRGAPIHEFSPDRFGGERQALERSVV